VAAPAAGAAEVGVDQGAAERRVDPAGPLVRDHEPDLIVLEQEVADPADRVRPADRVLERADPLRGRERRRPAAARGGARDERCARAEPDHSASSAASCARLFASSR
jgi:hypothetical protein